MSRQLAICQERATEYIMYSMYLVDGMVAGVWQTMNGPMTETETNPRRRLGQTRPVRSPEKAARVRQWGIAQCGFGQNSGNRI
jgi:hypothetical protein